MTSACRNAERAVDHAPSRKHLHRSVLQASQTVGLSRKFSCILSLPSSKSVSRQGPEEHAFYTRVLVAKNSICQRSVPSSLILRKLGQVPSTCAAGKYVYLTKRERGEKEKREPSNVRVIARNSRTISIQSSRQGSRSSISASR